MDYNFSWPKVRIEPRLELGRRIALIDVLREIQSEIPDDAVYLYLLGVDNSGLGELLMDEFHKGAYDGEGSDANAVKIKPVPIPAALRKMVKEYITRTILKELTDKAYMSCIYVDFEAMHNTYPKFIRDALDSVAIAQNASLDDHRAAVLTLKAATCGGGLKHINDTSRGYVEAGYLGRVRDDQWKAMDFDVLSPRQKSKLVLFDSMYCHALSQMRAKNELLGPYEWSTFCDLMEVLTILEYCRGFREAANAYAVHEYAKMAAVGRERIARVCYDYPVSRLRSQCTGAIDSGLELYSKLSPAAALLVGRNVRVHWFHDICGTTNTLFLRYYDEKALRAHLEAKGPNTSSTAVRLFMEQEVAIERRKIAEISCVLKNNRRHDCYEGECEAPCECCDCAAC